MNLSSLLPLYQVGFRFRLTAETSPGVLHHAAITAWVRRLMGSPKDFDLYVALDLPDWMFPMFQQGDEYHFKMVVLSGGLPLLHRFERALQQPLSNWRWDAAMPFRENLQLEAIIDESNGEPITEINQLIPLTEDLFQHQCKFWQSQPAITVRLLSPLRLMRDKQERGQVSGESRYCRDNAHLTPALWQSRLHTTFAELLKRRDQATESLQTTASVHGSADIFWVDAAYRNVKHDEKPMGGVLGSLRIMPSNAEDPWLEQMVLGQYLGIGQRRAFGYGRYTMLQQGDETLPQRSCHSLLDRACDAQNLADAYRVIADNRRQRDEHPEHEDEEPNQSELNKILNMAGRLQRGDYQPPPLHGFVHTDSDGDLRSLAVPPFSDRVLHRAVAQALTPSLNTLMDPGSYGFRPGRSRMQARDQIQSLHRQGYRWVFESDIRHFFDTVPWPRLQNRLLSLLQDSALVSIIMQWMQSPVAYRSARIQRSRGLPQGSPLSPLLANVMLDDFDADLRDAGCRLVRFADDFVIVAKTKQAAEEAAVLAAKALVDTGLELKAEKTRVVSFAEGFRFLGYMFVDGMAVSVKPQRSGSAGKAPDHSWLAKVPQLQKEQDDDETMLEQAKGDDVLPVEPFSEHGRDLIVCGEPSLLYSRAGHLNVEREDEIICNIPWQHLNRLMLFGNHHITTPALKEAMKQGVVIHFASQSGQYIGQATAPMPSRALEQRWQDQIRFFADETHCLEGSKQLVRARIQHMIEVLRRREASPCKKACTQLKKSLRSLPLSKNLIELNGVEGSATRSYFKALQSLIPIEYAFTGRNRRPPRDPANALLSLGYTFLHHYMESLLYADGLLPWVGMYHQRHGSHATLASDLMEPFRHQIEREVIRVLSNKQLKPEDFNQEDGGCYLSAKARKFYFARLSAVFHQERKLRQHQHSSNLIESMLKQNRALIFWIQGKADRLDTYDEK